ncbi:hypothetical protein ADUPG1_009183 [Aduncisulcus paluster]|uniref:FAD synthase n=1 Tax=Aduncisulcus paluster TaxID=2918883 RepID=A0ABQ5KUM4_9EUKA|nr:hypothetical protein ADUPG1_009183 [Aduncisulcus paluster]
MSGSDAFAGFTDGDVFSDDDDDQPVGPYCVLPGVESKANIFFPAIFISQSVPRFGMTNLVLEDCAGIYHFITSNNSPLSKKIRKALDVICKAFHKYKRVAFSFNGGKDCTVVLHLLRTAIYILSNRALELERERREQMKERSEELGLGSTSERSSVDIPSSASSTIFESASSLHPPSCFPSAPSESLYLYTPHKFSLQYPMPPREVIQRLAHAIPSFYLDTGNQFPEVESFFYRTLDDYNLCIDTVSSHDYKSFKELLQTYVEEHKVEAVFVGVRKTDPDGKDMSYFTPSTPGWVDVVRVAPVLDWSYVDIWEFLLRFRYEYCELYDRGYTSLGAPHNTITHSRLNRDLFRPISPTQAAQSSGDDGKPPRIRTRTIVDKSIYESFKCVWCGKSTCVGECLPDESKPKETAIIESVLPLRPIPEIDELKTKRGEDDLESVCTSASSPGKETEELPDFRFTDEVLLERGLMRSQVDESAGESDFLPAYCMIINDDERCTRVVAK